MELYKFLGTEEMFGGVRRSTHVEKSTSFD